MLRAGLGLFEFVVARVVARQRGGQRRACGVRGLGLWGPVFLHVSARTRTHSRRWDRVAIATVPCSSGFLGQFDASGWSVWAQLWQCACWLAAAPMWLWRPSLASHGRSRIFCGLNWDLPNLLLVSVLGSHF
mmetsp:Transcript_32066/g.70251  ORF Transcript_32066/g.70251 Transcript_32066/m.70251 type:complete len:132 (-) Transcript_32066:65-460(-)